MATAFKLFDRACFGDTSGGPPGDRHPGQHPQVHPRRARGLGAAAVHRREHLVGVAGNVDPDRIVAAARAAFGDMPSRQREPGRRARLARWNPRRAGCRDRASCTSSSASRRRRWRPRTRAFVVAAAVLGEGMSSPLLDQLRERRGLVYHADCWTDVRDTYGQFVIEASTAPGHFREYVRAVTRLLHQHVGATDPSVFSAPATRSVCVSCPRAKSRRGGSSWPRSTSSHWVACARAKGCSQASTQLLPPRCGRPSRECWTQPPRSELRETSPRTRQSASPNWSDELASETLVPAIPGAVIHQGNAAITRWERRRISDATE